MKNVEPNLTPEEIIRDEGYWAGVAHLKQHYKDMAKDLKKTKAPKQIAIDCGGSIDCYSNVVMFNKGWNSALNKLTKVGIYKLIKHIN